MLVISNILDLISHGLYLALCDIGMFDCNDPDYNFYCLADFLKCDGVDHCPNKNDEKDCPGNLL